MDHEVKREHPLAHVPEGPFTRRTLLRGAGVAGATLLGGSLLAACGSGGSASTTAAGGKVTLEFWDLLWGGAKYEATARSMVAAFEQAHPNIKVKYRLIPWSNWLETYTTAVATGTTPDVSSGGTHMAFEFGDACAPLNDLIDQWKSEGTFDDFIGDAIARNTVDGKVACLPWALATRGLLYNRKLLAKAGYDAPPANLTELREVARACSSGKVSGMGFSGVGDPAGGFQLLTLFQSNGGGIYDKACQPSIANPRDAEVGQFIQDLVRDGSVPKPAAGWTFFDLTNAIQRNEIAMFIHDGVYFNQLTNGADIGVAPTLTGFHGDKGAHIQDFQLMMYSTTKSREASTEFLKWWSENMKPLWTRGGITAVPVRTTLADSLPLMRDPRSRIVLDDWVTTSHTIAYPCETPDLAKLNKVDGQAFMGACMQDLLSLKDVNESLEKAQTALSQV